jgi:hypothetical protein
MDAILNKVLAKDRERRYATASELARELGAVSSTFQESTAPRVVRPTAGKDATTEMDVEESSQSTFEERHASQPEVGGVNTVDSSPSFNTPPIPQKRARQSPVGALQIVAAAVGVLLLFFVCGSLGLFGTWAGLQGLFPAQTPSVLPAPTATQSNMSQGAVLLEDDFSDSNSGWPDGQNAEATYGYQADGYHIFVNGLERFQWVYIDRVHEDASIYVDATPVAEGANGYYGLLCRIQDDRNFYYFVIQTNGSYNIGKYENAAFNPFFADWKPNRAIRTGNQTNQIRADCTANMLRLYVNNVLVDEVTDADFTSGLSGILAATLDDRDFEVRFNSFMVRKSSQ